MRKYRRVWTILLAFALLWGMLPAGLTLDTPARAASPVKISSAAEWDKLLTDNGGKYIGDIELTADIDFSKDVRCFSSFWGTFNGNGHQIRIPGEATFNSAYNSYQARGLFGVLENNNTTGQRSVIKNLVVKVAGPINLFDSAGSIQSAGILVGNVVSGDVENCAVIAENDTAVFRFFQKELNLNHAIAMGGIVGRLSDGTVRRCYSDIDLWYASGLNLTHIKKLNPSAYPGELAQTEWRSLGGLVGMVVNNGVIIDSGCYGSTIEAIFHEPFTKKKDVYLVDTGGILGTNMGSASITNCLVENITFRHHSFDISYDSITNDEMFKAMTAWNNITQMPQGTSAMESLLGSMLRPGSILGGASGPISANTASISNSYYNAWKRYAMKFEYTGGTNKMPAADQLNRGGGSTDRGIWADTLYGAPNLVWMLNESSQPDEVKVAFETGGVATLEVDPATPTTGGSWNVDVVYPIKSVMPTPHGAQILPATNSMVAATLADTPGQAATGTLYPGMEMTLALQAPAELVNATWVSTPPALAADQGILTPVSGSNGLVWKYKAPSTAVGGVTLNFSAYPEVDSQGKAYSASFQIDVARPTLRFDTWLLPEDRTDLAAGGYYKYQWDSANAPEQTYDTATGIELTQNVPLKVWTAATSSTGTTSAYRKGSALLTYTIRWPDGNPELSLSGTVDTEIPAFGETVSITGKEFKADYSSTKPVKMNLDTLLKNEQGDYERAAGEVSARVYNPNGSASVGIVLDAHKPLFLMGKGDSQTGGGNAVMPVIYPLYGDQIDTSVGVTITVSSLTDGDQIMFFTLETTQGSPAGASGYDLNKFKPYTGARIDFPTAANVRAFEVWAYTKSGGNANDSAVAYRLYQRDGDLPTPEPPGVYLKGSDGAEKLFSDTGYYEAGSTVVLKHSGLADGGSIYYTFGINSDPTDASQRTLYMDQDGKRPVLPSGNNTTIYLKAYFVDKYGMASAVSTSIIRLSPALDAPQASPPSGSSIRSGQPLILTLPDATLRKLDSNYGTASAFLARVYYGGDGQLHGPLVNGQPSALPPSVMADSDPGVTLDTNNPPVAGTEYISVLFSGDYLMPEIRYLMGDGALNVNSLQYNYGMRKVTAGYVNGAFTYTVSYQQPTALYLTGNSGSSVKVQAMTRSMDSNMANSASATYSYQVLPKAEAPRASPDTSQDKVYTMRPDGSIKLTSTTAGARIYYTDDDSTPALDASGIPMGTTKLYDAAMGIPMKTDTVTFYTIRAFAVANGYDQSDTVMFPYQLPAQVQAVMASPGEGDVEKGTKVELSCSTDGATIYYTTDGSDPEPYKSAVYKSAIEINEDTTITALAELNGMTSVVTEYEYDVAGQLSPPEASVPTGSIVSKGAQITLYAKRGSIAFTLDGSDPKELVEASKKDDSSSGSSSGGSGVNVTVNNTQKDDSKVYYGTKATIDAEPGETVTLRAYCYETGYTASEIAAFTYTISADGDYLISVPPAESTVAPGSVITLSTGITNGRIFYTTGSETPAVYNTYENDDDYYYDDEDDRKNRRTHYYWEASGNTLEGNTVTVEAEPGAIFTIRALVAADEAQAGAVQVLTYTVADRTPAPTATIPSGAYVLKGAATELTAREGDIFYTTDGTDPTTSSRIYTESIQVLGSMVLKAIAVAEGKQPSQIVQYVYTYAGQAAAPVMSVPGGEIAQGTMVGLATATEGASIYYSTDGSEPDTGSTLYTGPISVMRAVTIKARAFKEGLDDSVVNSATYTVNIPPKPPTLEETEGGPRITGTNRLQSRRTYSEDTGGPAFSDVVLTDPSTNVILSGPAQSLTADVTLSVKLIEPAPHERETVKNQLDNEIVSLFDVTIVRGGEQVQPTGQVELGLPIPAEVQNGLITVCRILDDGTVAAYPTRRSGGVAYVLVDHFSKYAVTAPESAAAASGLPLAALAGLSVSIPALAATAGVAVYMRRKKKKSGGAS